MQLKTARDFIQVHARSWTRRGLAALVILILALNSGLRADQAEGVIAVVNDHEVTAEEFQAFFNRMQRSALHHGTPPPALLEKYRTEALQELLDRLLLLDEANRRGLQPDEEIVAARLKKLIQPYQGSPDWEQHKDVMTASLREQLAGGQIIHQLEEITREVRDPSEQELLAYYESHPDTFTEPRQNKVSLILLGVDPSSSQEVREEALAQAESLVNRLQGGEDFASLAREFSVDRSNETGGNMGYLHENMLNDQAEAALSELEIGQISKPVKTLEGYAIFRLDDVREPVRKQLGEVRERATALWQRDEGEKAWNSLIEELHQSATISILDPSLTYRLDSGTFKVSTE